MTPRLILLTGPAADDVANALNPDNCERCDVSMDPCSLCPVRLGFEVRDYLDAPRSISDLFCGCKTATPEGRKAARSRAEAMDRAIRSLPGGEAWLVGLVLPATVPYTRLPARLAILAPVPPQLLVKRVRAWGGEVWWCESTGSVCRIKIDEEGYRANSWPEAVLAALERES